MDRHQRPPVRLDTGLESLVKNPPRDGLPRVLATVVATAGSTYRKPGARMLLMADGSYLGLLTGGCLESDLGEHARRVIRSGVPRIVEYDMRGPDDTLFGIGAGCEGAMRVLLEPAGAGSPAALALDEAARATHEGRNTTLISVYESGDVPLGTQHGGADLPPQLSFYCAAALEARRSCPVDVRIEDRRTRAWVQFLAPAPHLLILRRRSRCAADGGHGRLAGLAGDGGRSSAGLCSGRTLSRRVGLVDRPAPVGHGLDPGRVSCGRGHESSPVVRRALLAGTFPRTIARLHRIAGPGGAPPARPGGTGPAAAGALHHRLRGPVGIDIGAVTPEGIALSIVSQIHAWLGERTRREVEELVPPQNATVAVTTNVRGSPSTKYPEPG